MAQNVHIFQVIFYREDRQDSVVAGEVSFLGENYDTFGETEAREALLLDGRLSIGPELTTFGGTIVPTAKLDRVNVTLVGKSLGS